MLKPGDVVTDLDRNSMFWEKQGQVEHVQLCFWTPPEVTVRFDRELYPYSLGFDEHVDGVRFVYRERDLRHDIDWEPKVYAERYFKGDWNTVFTTPVPLDPAKPCMAEGCPHTQVKTLWINECGNVANVHVCAEHAKLYTKYPRMDSFPWRQQSA